jgi:ethylmalonyl-CoA mutase
MPMLERNFSEFLIWVGAVNAVEYMKQQLVTSHAKRRSRIESGDAIVVGVNAFQSSEPNPLLDDIDAAVQMIDPEVEARAIADLQVWRKERDEEAVDSALTQLRMDAQSNRNLMEASLACARAGVTTGQWAGVLREVFGEYRAPTGIDATVGVVGTGEDLHAVRRKVADTARERGAPLRMLVGKPGLDGHSNGAEQIAVRARDAGFEVVYQGIRLTPEQIVSAAVAEDVDVVGLSILSGSHRALVPEVIAGLRAAGAGDIPVVVGGIIPDVDAVWLHEQGVAAVFTPKDYDATAIMSRIVDLIGTSGQLRAG